MINVAVLWCPETTMMENIYKLDKDTKEVTPFFMNTRNLEELSQIK